MLLARISDYVTHYAHHAPNREALIFGDEVMTYAALADEVERFAKALLAKGVESGDRIAVLTTPQPRFFISFLAAASIGAIWVGLNPNYTSSELSYTIGDCEPKLIFSIAEFEGRDYTADLAALQSAHACVKETIALDAPMAGATSRADFLAAGAVVSNAVLRERQTAVSPESCCLIVYTSGSTGRPKGAMLSHYALCYGYSEQAARWAGIIGAMRGICNLPVNHIGCLGDLCCVPLVAGGAIVFMERFDPQGMVAAIPRWRVNILASVPTVLQMVLTLPEIQTADLSSLKMIAWGGAAVSAGLLAHIRALGKTPGLAYGMSEVPGSISMSDPDASDEVLLNTAGRPMLPLKLVDEAGAVVADGAAEVAVKHPSVMLGYFKRPEQTAVCYTDDGYFRTGDIGILRKDGNLQLVGRAKEMFKSGGYNVYPREIELCLEAHPAVLLTAVVGVPDAIYQEVGHAHVVVTDDTLTEAELKAWCRQQLANYKIPKRIIFHQQLPMLPVGKVDKVQLRAAFTD